MKVCHILTHNIKREGGTEIAVKNIRGKNDIISLGSGGPLLYLKSFLLAARLVFSDYDIIHVHDMSGSGYTFVPKVLRKKTVYSCHGLWTTYFGRVKNKNLRSHLTYYFLTRFQERIIRNADIVVATSRFRQHEIKSIYGIDSVYIHNGIDTGKFKPLKIKKEFDFLWVGTNPKKGLDFALRTAKSKGTKLLVVGLDGKNTDNVNYIKRAKHDEMPTIYNKSKTLMNYSMISRYDFVVLEAMACGINVIINKESAKELMPGRKFPRDIVTISGRTGRKIAQTLSWKKAIEKYNNVYKELMAA